MPSQERGLALEDHQLAQHRAHLPSRHRLHAEVLVRHDVFLYPSDAVIDALDDLLRSDDPYDVRCGVGVRPELAARSARDDELAGLGDGVNASQEEIGEQRLLSQGRLLDGIGLGDDGFLEVLPGMGFRDEIVLEADLLEGQRSSGHDAGPGGNESLYARQRFGPRVDDLRRDAALLEGGCRLFYRSLIHSQGTIHPVFSCG